MKSRYDETLGQQEARNNNDIVNGFDNESKNAHWREYHDVSLDHPRISLATVSQLKNCLLLRLAGPLTSASSGYFSERVLRAITAGYKLLIINCKNLEDSTRMNWYPLNMSSKADLVIVFVGLPYTARDEAKQCWMGVAEELFDSQIQFKNSEDDAIKYLFNMEK
jgi:hypothetical protein